MKILKQEFFRRKTEIVARELLGKNLVRKIGKKEIRAMICEVEVYDGFSDKASHASRGKTERNFPMFGDAGYWYVYFTYGMHFMLNVVTGENNYPAAVLIRGVKLENGAVLNGPAKLTKFLRIDKKLNNKKSSFETCLWVEKGKRIDESKIKVSARIGVQSSGKYWSNRKLRFFL